MERSGTYQRSIMNLDKETGISIMKIDEELDAGAVSNQYKLELEMKMQKKFLKSCHY